MIGEILAAGAVLTVLMSLWVAAKYRPEIVTRRYTEPAPPQLMSVPCPNPQEPDPELEAMCKKLLDAVRQLEASADSNLMYYPTLASKDAKRARCIQGIHDHLRAGLISVAEAKKKLYV